MIVVGGVVVVSDQELTIAQAAIVVGGPTTEAARRRVERAIADHKLAWHPGPGGKRKLIYRSDLVAWITAPSDSDENGESNESGAASPVVIEHGPAVERQGRDARGGEELRLLLKEQDERRAALLADMQQRYNNALHEQAERHATTVRELQQQLVDAERRAATLAEQARQRDAQTTAATPEQPVTHPWWQVWRPGR